VSRVHIPFTLFVILNLTDCDNDTYGLECYQTCGNCTDGVQCNHVNGSCPNGCDTGAQGNKCDESKDPSMYI
jgi:hypothetical protein